LVDALVPAFARCLCCLAEPGLEIGDSALLSVKGEARKRFANEGAFCLRLNDVLQRSAIMP